MIPKKTLHEFFCKDERPISVLLNIVHIAIKIRSKRKELESSYSKSSIVSKNVKKIMVLEISDSLHTEHILTFIIWIFQKKSQQLIFFKSHCNQGQFSYKYTLKKMLVLLESG